MSDVYFRYFGSNGVIAPIGMVIFVVTYNYANDIFSWIEDQTFGTRNYLLEKFELMFIEVNPVHITYALLFLSFGMGFLTFGLFALIGRVGLGFIVSTIIAVVGWKIPRPIVDYLVKRRIQQFKEQMTDALQLLSNGLRAGQSLPQACAMVVDELPKPVSQEFNMILQQNKIGVPLEECFENLAKRVPTLDNSMFVTSINILRESGGNLAEVFDTICEVVRERIRLEQKIDTYTAQGKFQGFTIFMMPFAVTLLYGAQDPDSVKRIFSHPLGLVIVAFALALNLAGGFFIMKIVRIKA
jgi:tight adherence protein B